MFALLCDLRGAPLDPSRIAAMAGALGAALPGRVEVHADGNLALMRYRDRRSGGPGWRPARGGDGALVHWFGIFDDPDLARRELECADRDDARLYAHARDHWGDTADLRLTGSFAACVIHRGVRAVTLTRSPLQAPPVYWHQQSGLLAAASLARAVVAGAGMAVEIDEQKIADSLVLNYSDDGRDWYRGVRRLAVGSRLHASEAGTGERAYYDVAATRSIRLPCDADYVEAATALFEAGTRAALRSAKRPAIALSGGLDSQGVAAFAAMARPELPMLGITAVPEAGWEFADARAVHDEAPRAAALAAQYPNLSSETVDSAGLPFDHRLDAMFLMSGGAPRNVMNFHWLHAVRERARAAGADVLLTGAMGNWSFSFDGTGAMAGWLRRGNWLRLARELAAMQGGVWRGAKSQVFAPLLPEGLYRALRPRGPSRLWSPIGADYAQEFQVFERAHVMGSEIGGQPPRDSQRLRAASIANAGHEMAAIRQAFELIHGLPLRDPTAYRPLVEFCIGVPDHQFVRDGERRWLARRMLRGRVPEAVRVETGRARQGADWPQRIARDRQALGAELLRLAGDPAMRRRFDIDRLSAALAAWSPAAGARDPHAVTIEFALPRAIATARFIDFVQGTNR